MKWLLLAALLLIPLPASAQMLLMGMGPGSSAGGFTPSTPAVATSNGFTQLVFNSNLNTNGLSGVDINGTNGPGYTWYTVPFQGETAPQPQGNWTYNGSDVYLNSVADNTSIGRFFTAGNSGASGTASIAGSTITVTAILAATGSGVIAPGQIIAGAGITPRTFSVLAYGTNGTTGTGGTGTYALSASVGTVNSEHVNFLSHVGRTFPPGGYYEACFSWDPTQSPASGTYHPSFWITDVFGNGNQNKVDNTYTTALAGPADYAELDFFESVPTGVAGVPTLTFNSPDWTLSTNYSGVGAFNSPTGAASWANSDLGSPTFTANHCYETLWVPTYQGAGTGSITRYFDGVVMPTKLNNPTTYTFTTGSTPAGTPSNPSGIWSVSESNNFNLIINGGPGTYGAHFTRVSVWQAPSNAFRASGPTTGVTGSPSASFYLGLTGGAAFNGSQTITIADGGNGGTFTPSVGSPGTSSVTVTPAAAATGFTFTYAAATDGAKTLTFTNAQGWTNQTPLTYTAAVAYVGPCDAGVGTFKVFFGVRKCTTSYAQSGMTVKRTSDNATCAVSYSGTTGLLDTTTTLSCNSNTQTAAQFCNATTCQITIMIDTSGGLACGGGSACNYTVGTPASMTLQFNCTGSIPCIQLTAATTATQTFLASSTQPFTVTAVANRSSGTTASSVFQTGSGATIDIKFGASATQFCMFAGTASQCDAAADASFNASTGVVNGASSTWKLNSAAPATTAATPGANATGTAGIRFMAAGASVTNQVMEFGLMNGAMSSGNQTTLYNNQSAFYGSIF